jgi:hypothetical protein
MEPLIDSEDERVMWARLGDFLTQRAVEADCTPIDYVRRMLIEMGLPHTDEWITDMTNRALRASFDDFTRSR